MAFSLGSYGYCSTLPAPSRVAHGATRGEAARAALEDALQCAAEQEEERRLEEYRDQHRDPEYWVWARYPVDAGHWPDPPWVKALKTGGEPLRWTLGG